MAAFLSALDLEASLLLRVLPDGTKRFGLANLRNARMDWGLN